MTRTYPIQETEWTSQHLIQDRTPVLHSTSGTKKTKYKIKYQNKRVD